MAEITVTPRPLEEVAHSEVNGLFDVIALLAAAEDRVDAASSAKADDQMHNTLRLLQMARMRVQGSIDAITPYI